MQNPKLLCLYTWVLTLLSSSLLPIYFNSKNMYIYTYMYIYIYMYSWLYSLVVINHQHKCNITPFFWLDHIDLIVFSVFLNICKGSTAGSDTVLERLLLAYSISNPSMSCFLCAAPLWATATVSQLFLNCWEKSNYLWYRFKAF